MVDFEQGGARLGVVGAGAMGQGIVQVALQGGLRVVLHDAREGAAEDGAAKVVQRLERLAEKGRLETGQVEAMRGRLEVVDSLDGFAACKAVIEAVVEDLEVKQAVFRELEGVVRPDCLLASNTSSLPIASIASACEHRGRIAGLHFFNPVPLMRLVEVIRSVETSAATVQALIALGKRLGRTPVEVKDSPGFLVNLGGRAFTTEGLRLMQEGVATPAQVDAILRDCGGFRMGPFELMDLTGMDVNYPVSRIVFEAFQNDPRLKTTPDHKLLVDAGRLGRKSGAGHYRYDQSGKMIDPPSPDHDPDAEPVSAVFVPEVEPPLRHLIDGAGLEALETDDGSAPIVAALLGEDASSFAVRTGVDVRRLVALDLTGDTGTRLTIMTAPGADPAIRDALAAALIRSGRKIT
ncbi:MAG: 3-hydroxyacyl-CoA dehydrogenase NAD-binding domain-containing protein, partial [Geminicoccaceae bacterium]|nr:3-hydroxyacyl-CoA dehydrogenase NAD-binding domain-containing protein [Geminicoccaceae bacterium]